MSFKGPEDSIMLSVKEKSFIPVRHVFTILGFLGFINLYTMRLNLSVAIIAMVKESHHTSKLNLSEQAVACSELLKEFPYANSSAKIDSQQSTGEFDWDSQLHGLVLGAFFYGYLVTQFPGGMFAEKYGGKWLLGIALLISSIFTLLTPLAARWSVWALVVVRVIEGLAGGVAYPAIATLIGKWAPKLERSRIAATIFTGSNVGTVFTLSISGMLCHSDFLGGWPSVFYVFGSLTVIWFILWAVLVSESPDSHPSISREELLLITLGREERIRAPTPWKAMLTSIPFWTVVITHFGECWGFYTIVIEMPLYLSEILHFDLNENGLLSALPNLTLSIASIIASFIADKARASGKLSNTVIRKILNSIGFFGPAICLLAIAVIGCDPWSILILLSLAMALNGFAFSGFICTFFDMNPDFSGPMYGISNTLASVTGFLVPAYVGWIVQDGQTVRSWSIVFLTSSAILTITGIIYDVFASAELQPWFEDLKTSNKEPIKEQANVNSKL